MGECEVNEVICLFLNNNIGGVLTHVGTVLLQKNTGKMLPPVAKMNAEEK